MSHQLSHTFSVCDVEAQVTVRPPSVSSTHPTELCATLRERAKRTFCSHVMCGSHIKMGCMKYAKASHNAQFSTENDKGLLHFLSAGHQCKSKGKPPYQGAKCYCSSLLCQQNNSLFPRLACSLRYHSLVA